MSTLSVPGTAWQWPADVLAFAAENSASDYIDAMKVYERDVLRQVTWRP